MSVLIYARRELVPLTGMGVEPPGAVPTASLRVAVVWSFDSLPPSPPQAAKVTSALVTATTPHRKRRCLFIPLYLPADRELNTNDRYYM